MGFRGQDPQFNMLGLGRQCFLVQILKTTDSNCVTISMFKTELILSGFVENNISTDIQSVVKRRTLDLLFTLDVCSNAIFHLM